MNNKRAKTKLKMPARWLCYAIGVAYASLLPKFYAFTNAETRFTLKWGWSHYGSILLAVGILGGLGWIASVTISLALYRLRMERMRLWIHTAYGLIACMVFTRCVTDIAHDSAGLAMMLPDRLFGSLLGRGILLGSPALLLWVATRRRFLAVARSLCLLSFIMFVLFAIVSLSYPRYEQFDELPPLPAPPAEATKESPSIFILIFDTWSYSRAYPGGVLRDDLPNLAALAKQADTYHRHFSAGTSTIPSMSRFLLQRDRAFLDQGYRDLIQSLRSNHRPDGPSIFSGHSNYFRAAFGLLLDYSLILGEDVDYVAHIPFMDRTATVGQRVSELLFKQLIGLRHFGVPVTQLTQRKRGGGGNSLSLQLPLLFSLAERAQFEPVYAFCHMLLPHFPYVWDTGGLIGSLDFRSRTDSYLGNLRYMDTVLGQFIQLLKEADSYDNTLLIVTSDHSWGEDPDVWPTTAGSEQHEQEDQLPESNLKHVPLLVKRPGQKAGNQIYEHLSSIEIYQTFIRPILESTQPADKL